MFLILHNIANNVYLIQFNINGSGVVRTYLPRAALGGMPARRLKTREK